MPSQSRSSFADLSVNEEIIVELSCGQNLNDEHRAQCINSLTATNRNLTLFMSFQRPGVEVRRIIHD